MRFCYTKVDLDKTSCIILSCGYIFNLENMDDYI